MAEGHLNLGNALVTNMVSDRVEPRRWFACPDAIASSQDFADALKSLQAAVQAFAQSIREPLQKYVPTWQR